MDAFINRLKKAHALCPGCPSPRIINRFFEDVLGILFPEHSSEVIKEQGILEIKFFNLRSQLQDILKNNVPLHQRDGEVLANDFF